MRDFSFKYLIVVLAFGLISAFAFYFDSRGIFFRLPVFVVFAIIGFVIIAIGYLTILIHLLLDRRFTKALSVLLGVITLCVVAFGSLPIARNAAPIIDKLRFQLSRSYYSDIVKNAANDGAPRLLKFEWGSWSMFLSGDVVYLLIFDEIDELPLPDDRRTTSWKARASRTFGFIFNSKCRLNINNLSEHYYLVESVCDRGSL
jgi:hypothetical protein